MVRADQIPRGAPAAFHQPPLDVHLVAVREAWTDAQRAHDTEHPPFVAALNALAAAARASGVPVTELLKAADSLTRSVVGGDPKLVWDHVRPQVGRRLIQQYYASPP